MEKIDLINEADYPLSYYLTLLLADAVFSQVFTHRCYENGKKNTLELCKPCKKKVDKINSLISKLGFSSCNITAKSQKEGFDHFNLVTFYVNNHGETFPLMPIDQGIPKTSLEALEKGETILFETLPKEFWYLKHFAQIPFSKNHWRKEIEIVKYYADVIKEVNPPLYNSMIGA